MHRVAIRLLFGFVVTYRAKEHAANRNGAATVSVGKVADRLVDTLFNLVLTLQPTGHGFLDGPSPRLASTKPLSQSIGFRHLEELRYYSELQRIAERCEDEIYNRPPRSKTGDDDEDDDEHYERCRKVAETAAAEAFDRVLADVQASKRDGIRSARTLIPESLRDRLNTEIDLLKSNEIADYHPGSDGVVRDLVHPGLYPFVKNTSRLKGANSQMPEGPSGSNSRISTDYWGRPYERSDYQWLPAEVQIGKNRTGFKWNCRFATYINNLNSQQYPSLVDGLEELLGYAMPLLQECYKQTCEESEIRGSPVDIESSGTWSRRRASAQSNGGVANKCFGDVEALQVIVKIADYELHPNQTHEGVWHVEGMSHERIMATALYVVDKDERISGGDLLFKRGCLENECDEIWPMAFPQDHHYMERYCREIPLGKATLSQGTMAVWPNSLIHKVSEMKHVTPASEHTDRAEIAPDRDGRMKLRSGSIFKTNKGAAEKFARRRIIAFWLVDPEERIVSTKDVPPQQDAMSRKDALSHRLKMMEERKRHKQTYNLREVSLCEH